MDIRHPQEVPHQHGGDRNLSAEVHVDGGALDRRVREVLHRVSQPWVVDPRQAWLWWSWGENDDDADDGDADDGDDNRESLQRMMIDDHSLVWGLSRTRKAARLAV